MSVTYFKGGIGVQKTDGTYVTVADENGNVDAPVTTTDLTVTGSVAATTTIKSSGPTSGVGYATGAGGAVTQITTAATGVALSKVTGQITTVALTTAAGAEEEFIVTNTAVAATDVVVVGTTYAGAGTPIVSVKGIAAGSFVVNISNLHAANALNAVVVINFAVIKAVAA